MIGSYFFRRLLTQSALFLSILTGIFVSCNLFIRFPFIYTASVVPMLVIAMLPLMIHFALPIATSFAVYTTIIQHRIHNELLFCTFVRKAQRSLCKAIGFFIIIVSFFYAVLVFQFAPKSYQIGKRLLLNVACDQIRSLEPNKFHALFPSCTIFFKEKHEDNTNNPIFSTILLIFDTHKQPQIHCFFTAQQGFFNDNKFMLRNGALHTIKNGQFHKAAFKDAEININTFINDNAGLEQLSQVKFLPFKSLLASAAKDSAAFVELNKRFSQILWQCVQPIILFFLGCIINYFSLLLGILACGLLYLCSYIFLTIAHLYAHAPCLMLIFFYVPIIVFLIIGWYFYRKRSL